MTMYFTTVHFKAPKIGQHQLFQVGQRERGPWVPALGDARAAQPALAPHPQREAGAVRPHLLILLRAPPLRQARLHLQVQGPQVSPSCTVNGLRDFLIPLPLL